MDHETSGTSGRIYEHVLRHLLKFLEYWCPLKGLLRVSWQAVGFVREAFCRIAPTRTSVTGDSSRSTRFARRREAKAGGPPPFAICGHTTAATPPVDTVGRWLQIVRGPSLRRCVHRVRFTFKGSLRRNNAGCTWRLLSIC